MATQLLENQQVPGVRDAEAAAQAAKEEALKAQEQATVAAEKATEAEDSANEAIATAQEAILQAEEGMEAANAVAKEAADKAEAATTLLNENIDRIDGAVEAANEAKETADGMDTRVTAVETDLESRVDIKSIDEETLELDEDGKLKVIGGGGDVTTDMLDSAMFGGELKFADKDIYDAPTDEPQIKTINNLLAPSYISPMANTGIASGTRFELEYLYASGGGNRLQPEGEYAFLRDSYVVYVGQSGDMEGARDENNYRYHPADIPDGFDTSKLSGMSLSYGNGYDEMDHEHRAGVYIQTVTSPTEYTFATSDLGTVFAKDGELTYYYNSIPQETITVKPYDYVRNTESPWERYVVLADYSIAKTTVNLTQDEVDELLTIFANYALDDPLADGTREHPVARASTVINIMYKKQKLMEKYGNRKLNVKYLGDDYWGTIIWDVVYPGNRPSLTSYSEVPFTFNVKDVLIDPSLNNSEEVVYIHSIRDDKGGNSIRINSYGGGNINLRYLQFEGLILCPYGISVDNITVNSQISYNNIYILDNVGFSFSTDFGGEDISINKIELISGWNGAEPIYKRYSYWTINHFFKTINSTLNLYALSTKSVDRFDVYPTISYNATGSNFTWNVYPTGSYGGANAVLHPRSNNNQKPISLVLKNTNYGESKVAIPPSGYAFGGIHFAYSGNDSSKAEITAEATSIANVNITAANPSNVYISITGDVDNVTTYQSGMHKRITLPNWQTV